jgi:hypothetical protein
MQLGIITTLILLIAIVFGVAYLYYYEKDHYDE